MGEKNKTQDAVKKWLSERGYDYEVRTYVPEASGAETVKKEKDTIYIPAEVENEEMFMRQFEKSFESIKEVTELNRVLRTDQ